MSVNFTVIQLLAKFNTRESVFWYHFANDSKQFVSGIEMTKFRPANEVSILSEEDFRAFQAGSQAVFRRIYDSYYNLTLYICRRCNLSVQSTDEIVQDTFLKLFTNAGAIESPAKIKAWIAATCRNACIDQLRRQRRDSVVSDPTSDDFEPGHNENEGAPARELELKLVGEFIQELLDEPGGDTFSMFYRDGKTVSEIAKEKNEAISTVTTRLTRMRRKFSELLRARIDSLRANSCDGSN